MIRNLPALTFPACIYPALFALLALFLTAAPRPAAANEWPFYLPPTETASRDLVVVRWDDRTRITDLTVRSLQGLVNRTTPTIWVGTEDGDPGDPGWWLRRITQMGLVNPDPPRLTVSEFLNAYKDRAKGVVIPPFDIGSDAHHVAVAHAAADGLIVGNTDTALQLGLPVVMNYKGRFADHAEMYRYIFDTFIKTGRLNLTAFICERNDLATSTRNVDYAVQQKLFTFCWHENNLAEVRVLEEIFHYMPDVIPMLGTPGGGRGYTNEGETINLISRYGKFALPSSGADNLSLRTGFPPLTREEAKQNLRTPPEYDPSKVYVMLQLSDGDNSNMYRMHHLRKAWAYRGRVPIGWSVGMGVYELLPDCMRYFYSQKTELDEFFQSISGLGYTFADTYARGAYRFGPAFPPARSNEAWQRFLYRGAAFMPHLDLQVTATHQFTRIENSTFARYAGVYQSAEGLLNGYNKVASQYGGNVTVINDFPIFHTQIDRNSGWEGLLHSDIAEAAGTRRPAFVQIFWVPFSADFDWGINELETLPEEYVVVLPSEFAAFYRKANGLPEAPSWPDFKPTAHLQSR